MHIQHFFHSKWVCCNEKLLNDCDLSEYWLTQNVPKNVILSKIVKQRLCDQFKQSWSESVFTSAKCLNKGNNKITELRTILQRESQNS